MFGDMMSKLKEAQQKVEATKERMNTVFVDEQSSDGLFKTTLTANRQVKNVEIHPDLLEDKEQLEDYIISVMNKALDKAEQIHDTEVGAVAKEGMPSIPGMDMFK